MGKEEVLGLHTLDIKDYSVLTPEAIIHLLQALDSLWMYDYEAAKSGRVGYHAELRSGKCSDGFLNFAAALQHYNIQQLLAMALARKFVSLGVPSPGFVAGIPNAATGLGIDFASALGIGLARLEKDDQKRIRMLSSLDEGRSLLLVEDVCTTGSGFSEAVREIAGRCPDGVILPFELVIFNRGGVKQLPIEGVGTFQVVSLAEQRFSDWEPDQCPLCAMGSKRIKPKPQDHPENWEILVNSQLVSA